MPFEFIQETLEARRQQQLFRKPVIVEQAQDAMIQVNGAPYISFSSNDYLGLNQHPQVLQAWLEGIAMFGGGSGASPLVTGFSRAHQTLSEKLSEMLNRDAVILFNSGFAANQAISQALFSNSGQLIADKLAHASLIEAGIHLSLSKHCDFKRFRHNDLDHLDFLLETSSFADKLVASEGVFSMDGDSPKLTELAKLAHHHGAWLMLDDAHGFGVLGDKGEGLVAAHLAQNECQIIMATLGKSCGTAGAFVAGSQSLIDFLSNYAKHYIYSTAMPPAQAHATSQAISLIQSGEQREKLHANIAYFKQQIQSFGFDLLASNSAIQPIIIGSADAAIAFSEQLKTLGIWLVPIRYPTVPKGKARLRLTLSSLHDNKDIDALIDALCIVRDRS